MRILLADDERSLRRVLQFKLEKRGHEVTAVENGQQALDRLADGHWDIVVSDIRMPGVDGIELLERARSAQPDLKVILLTAYATVAQAVQAVKLGAFDYVTKPFEDDELFAVIEKAMAFRNLEQENRALKGRLRQRERVGRLIGVSQPFKEMMQIVDRVAASDATILLSGESGTGKELVARTIHDRSDRSDREFVAVNCGAIPKDLVESEMFGHVKGAFTGAIRAKRGKFEIADGGTILLDEIGELPLDVQVKLLRVLQERVVEPVGGERAIEIDVRVIASTNVDLKAQVADKKFREDLYYRLNVIPLHVPSLAEREDDIPLLVKEFVSRASGRDDIRVAPALMKRLCESPWPGNIRELENVVERMVVLRTSDELAMNDLPADFDKRVGAREDAGGGRPHPTFREAEEKLIREALEACGWNRARAARYLNVPRHVLIYRMKKHRIEKADK